MPSHWSGHEPLMTEFLSVCTSKTVSLQPRHFSHKTQELNLAGFVTNLNKHSIFASADEHDHSHWGLHARPMGRTTDIDSSECSGCKDIASGKPFLFYWLSHHFAIFISSLFNDSNSCGLGFRNCCWHSLLVICLLLIIIYRKFVCF